MDINDVVQGGASCRFPPHFTRQGIAGHDLPVMTRQVVQEVKLFGGQFDRSASPGDLPGPAVQHQRVEPKTIRIGGPPPTADRAQPGEELGKRERLDKIVVGTGVEPDDSVIEGVAGGQHDDRGGDTTATQIGEHVEPVTTWQRQIEKHCVERVALLRETSKRRLASALDDHAVALPLKSFAQGAGHLLFVLDHEQTPPLPGVWHRRGKGHGHVTKLIEDPCACTGVDRLQTNFRRPDPPGAV